MSDDARAAARLTQPDRPESDRPESDRPESDRPESARPEVEPAMVGEPPQRTPESTATLPSSPISTDSMSPGPLPLPRWFAFVAVTSSILLIPWIVYLAFELPSHTRAEHYDVAWVGFDVAMFAALTATAYAALKRTTWTEPFAICTATLLVVDAWFDVVTSAHRGERIEALASALLIEIPLAVMCGWVAHNTERLRRRAYRKLWRRIAVQDLELENRSGREVTTAVRRRVP